MEFVQETERIIQNMNKFSYPSDVHMTHESSHFENPGSISSYQPELDQHQILDSLTSYLKPEIELEDECESEFQFSDSSLILESISTPVVLPKLSNVLEPILIPIIPVLESIISPIHISSVNKNQDSISLHSFEIAQNLENHLDILASYDFLKLNLSLKVILNLKLVIPFHFLIQ